MKILHLLAAGDIGGIEVLAKNIIKYSKEDNRICFLFKEGIIYEELSKEYKTNIVMSLKNFKLGRKIKILLDYCAKEGIEVIILHNQGMKPNIIYNILCKKLRKKNVKFVMYIHSAYDEYYNPYKNYIIKSIYEVLIKKTMKYSNLVVYISKKVKETFYNHFHAVVNKNDVVIYNGIDDKFFENVSGKNKKENKNIKIIYVGRLSKEKGVDILIDAMKIVISKIDDLRLEIVGDGVERDNLENKVKEYNLNNYVNFLGRQNNVIQYLDDADIFVYPSTWEEGFGISVVEAMARGCIPITFYKGGLPELIEDGVNGFLVKKVDATELAESIIRTVNLIKKEKANMIINNAINDAKKYSIRNTINNINYNLKKILHN